MLKELSAIGIERVPPAWFSADAPPYPKGIGATKLKKVGWADSAKDRKKAAALVITRRLWETSDHFSPRISPRRIPVSMARMTIVLRNGICPASQPSRRRCSSSPVRRRLRSFRITRRRTSFTTLRLSGSPQWRLATSMFHVVGILSNFGSAGSR